MRFYFLIVASISSIASLPVEDSAAEKEARVKRGAVEDYPELWVGADVYYLLDPSICK